MKQIFSYLIPYRARMALGFSIKVAATIVELLIPWALSIMVDKVIPTENIGFVFAWGGVMILFALLALTWKYRGKPHGIACCQKYNRKNPSAAVFKDQLFICQTAGADRTGITNFKINIRYLQHSSIYRYDAAPWRASAYHAYRRSCRHAFNGCAAYMYHAGTSSSHGTSCIFVFK